MSSGPGGAGGFKRIRALRSRSQVHSQDELGNSLQKDVTSLAQTRLQAGLQSSLDQLVTNAAPQHGGEQEFHTSTRLGAPSHVGSKTSLPENISSSGTRDCLSSQRSLPIEGQSHSGTDDSDRWVQEKFVVQQEHGKYKIVFASGETIPMEFEAEFATGVGIVIRTNADIRGVSHWREVPEENKEVCYARLFQWFDIEGWHTDERVNKIIDDKFQVAYTRWRNILHQEYKKLVDQGINPREVCPRPDLSMAKWQDACDFIQDEKYQVIIL
ncbi:hypothetical protein Salat_2608600 [Sesamum alatum]|uniref:Uncharacterized protein n=1 Tax=Sesamum alatum TaxID=300844 RepID=A0AAE1XN83_9LAMI|nr:hypothetical protein Salat_2608600 [Sesamum alatum]